ncbi:MAG TPA: deoxyribodipyrimidine photo-lyase [Methanomassiliicoccales archaeon]|nr:deoxyribodipyrimidine photo-lyase [Methanomassiliicoccales archaeon]
MNARRVKAVRKAEGDGPVIYWMSRDQRAEDNWALYHAWESARREGRELMVVFCLAPSFLEASPRHYAFMLAGLQEVEGRLQKSGIPMHLLRGEPDRTLPRFIDSVRASLLVTEFDPLRIKRQWTAKVMDGTHCGIDEVDAHNIIPCRLSSPKKEWAAYTFRPKVRLMLPEFIDDLPPVIEPLEKKADIPEHILKFDEVWNDWSRHKGEVPFEPGPDAGMMCMRRFIEQRLNGYAQARNDPNLDGQSGLSPYLHFGQISAQRLAWEVMGSTAPVADKEAFLEELIVRRELSDNFCHYDPLYDRAASFPSWAKETLAKHGSDKREYLYSLQELEQGRTHDPLWNAAQNEMRESGKMHGYLRMYWAKKVLEWSVSADEALQHAISLNDRYEMDGRDPNGYTGIAWSIGGVHDRAWPERPIFGKVRFMSLNGAKGKFDVERYVKRWSG